MYAGYLTEFRSLIEQWHAAGLSTRQIAEALYANGARAQASDTVRSLTHEQQIQNLRTMTLHVLQRLGLRAPRKRRGGLQLNARQRNGVWIT